MRGSISKIREAIAKAKQNAPALRSTLRAPMPTNTAPKGLGSVGSGTLTPGSGLNLANAGKGMSSVNTDDFTRRTPSAPMPAGGIGGALSRMAVKPTGAPTPGPNGMKNGGKVKEKSTSSYKSGGKTSSASKRGDGCAIKGKTKGRFV